MPAPYERNQTELHLPFNGEWFCVWGGDKLAINPHRPFIAQRYGFDFAIADDEDRLYRGNVAYNENSYSFGKEIISPAAGEVVEVVGDIPDNTTGEIDTVQTLGNFALVRHAEHQYSVLAQLKRGSLAVRQGQRIKRGEEIGRCGNSGDSTAPHLHFHMQDTPNVSDVLERKLQLATARGIRVHFTGVLLERNAIINARKRALPIRGDRVKNV
jgi:hypothetical protein